MDFTVTQHGAVMRVKFPSLVFSEADQTDQSRRISVVLNGGTDASFVSTDADGVVWITGKTTKNSGGVPSNFAHYFTVGIFAGSAGGAPTAKPVSTHADAEWAYADFSADDPLHDLLTVRIATSLISAEQSMLNFQREVGAEKSFDSVTGAARDEWRKVLSKVKVEEISSEYSSKEQEDMKTVLYSALYRTSIFPRQLTETDSNGNLIHWSPYSPMGEVFPGVLSTDSGFWDSYSSLYPLHSIINSDVLGKQMLQGIYFSLLIPSILPLTHFFLCLWRACCLPLLFCSVL